MTDRNTLAWAQQEIEMVWCQKLGKARARTALGNAGALLANIPFGILPPTFSQQGQTPSSEFVQRCLWEQTMGFGVQIQLESSDHPWIVVGVFSKTQACRYKVGCFWDLAVPCSCGYARVFQEEQTTSNILCLILPLNCRCRSDGNEHSCFIPATLVILLS